MIADTCKPVSSKDDFVTVRGIVDRVRGIDLGESRYEFVQSRLERRMSALDFARQAEYADECMHDVPAPVRRRHLVRTPEGLWWVADPIRTRVQFARLNLLANWPMAGPFDAVLCRNTTIYFDTATHAGPVERFAHLVRPGGYLYAGHSEVLPGACDMCGHGKPMIYRRFVL